MISPCRESCMHGSVILFIGGKKYPFLYDEFNYHDPLQARLKEGYRHYHCLQKIKITIVAENWKS